jgi:homocysteine S-methyltransferase
VTATLPPESGRLFVTDGGMETTLIYRDGFELPEFASFVLLDEEAGRAALTRYYDSYAALAAELGLGIVLDTPTWRASSGWGERLGYDVGRLANANRRGVALLQELRERRGDEPPILVSGCVGPKGDGYAVEETLTAEEAQRYHAPQVGLLADEGVDLVSALTLTYAGEAVGIARAAKEHGVPVVISFTVETDGRLPSGEAVDDAIGHVDAETDAVAYYMINCAHPTHFVDAIDQGADRIAGIRANASRRATRSSTPRTSSTRAIPTSSRSATAS